MENPKEMTHAKPEIQPDVETSKKPIQAIDEKGKPNPRLTVVPNPQDKQHKGPEKKSA